MAKVCFLAKNSVVRDARVLKEADSLARVGHSVTIVGLMDAHFKEPESFRESGVRIVLKNRHAILDGSQSLKERLAHYCSARDKLYALLLCAYQLRRKIFLGGISVLYAAFTYLLVSALPAQSLIAPVIAILVLAVINLAAIKLLISKGVLRRIIHRVLAQLSSAVIPQGHPDDESLPPKTSAYFNSHQLFKNGARRLGGSITLARLAIANRVMTSVMLKGALETNPSVVHCHDIEPLAAAIEAKQELGCKLIFDAHEIYEDIAQGDEITKARAKAILSRYSSSIDHFITINDSIAKFYAQNYPLPPATIVKNATVRAPAFEYDGRLHRAAGLPPGQRILLYQGGYAEKRGMRSLVKASAFLNPEWTLVMMGWGRLESELRELATAANRDVGKGRRIPCAVFIPPAPQDELARWSAGATVGTIPYENVGLNHLYCTPNKLWEYPNAGVPILCSRLEEMMKVVEEYKIGWLLPANLSPECVARTVNCLTDEEIARAKKACRSYMQSDDWSKYETRLLELYDEISAQSAASPRRAGPAASIQ